MYVVSKYVGSVVRNGELQKKTELSALRYSDSVSAYDTGSLHQSLCLTSLRSVTQRFESMSWQKSCQMHSSSRAPDRAKVQRAQTHYSQQLPLPSRPRMWKSLAQSHGSICRGASTPGIPHHDDWGAQTWLFQTWWFAIFKQNRSLAIFCALLRPFPLFCALFRSFVDLRLHSSRSCALFCAHLHVGASDRV